MKKAPLLIALFYLLILVNCKQGSEVSENYQTEVKEEIIQLSRLYFEAWERKDLETCMSILDEGFINKFF